MTDLDSASALRQAFDSSFATAPKDTRERLEGLLAIRIGTDPFALRLAEVAGLVCEPRIVPVPSPVRELLGITGRRGIMAPVYDLGQLLRYAPTVNARWMVLVGTPAVGFAFDTFEAHVQVPALRRAAEGMVRAAGALRPVIDMTALMQRLRSQGK